MKKIIKIILVMFFIISIAIAYAASDSPDIICWEMFSDTFCINGTSITHSITVQGNVTVDYLRGNLDYTNISSGWPAECPAGSAITKLNKSVTCTAYPAGDNLGNHIATQDLDMASYNIFNITNISIKETGNIVWNGILMVSFE